MIPQKYSPLLFAMILSGVMSLLVSGISTLRAAGLEQGFAGLWMMSWLTAWLFAFPIVLVVAPLTRRVVQLIVESR
tara:strand:+ start:1915 stop:2142 length:228 start_codon:yes stop_codon:yes gene_type:complete